MVILKRQTALYCLPFIPPSMVFTKVTARYLCDTWVDVGSRKARLFSAIAWFILVLAISMVSVFLFFCVFKIYNVDAAAMIFKLLTVNPKHNCFLTMTTLEQLSPCTS